MRGRRVGVLVVVAAGLVAVASLLLSGRGSGEAGFFGTPLDPPREARDFTLTDQFGEPVSLGDLRGRVVVLTFLYTSCKDVCPLVASRLHEAYDLLGDEVGQVAFLAVTVDPERDTREAVYRYSQRRGMLDRWHFLVGSRAELDPIWEHYWAGTPVRLSGTADGSEDKDYTVNHAAPVHVLDREGRVRVAYGSQFAPAELASDVERLLR